MVIFMINHTKGALPWTEMPVFSRVFGSYSSRECVCDICSSNNGQKASPERSDGTSRLVLPWNTPVLNENVFLALFFKLIMLLLL